MKEGTIFGDYWGGLNKRKGDEKIEESKKEG